MGNSLSRPNTFINKPSFSSTVSIELAILPGNSTPDSPISASEASQRQDSIQEVLFADETGIVKAWIQPHGKLKRVRLNQVCLSDEVLWCPIDLSLERLRLHKCTFDMTKPSHLTGLFKFLADKIHQNLTSNLQFISKNVQPNGSCAMNYLISNSMNIYPPPHGS